MKKGIHPEYKACKIVCVCGNVIETRSTVSPEIRVEICSVCHPSTPESRSSLIRLDASTASTSVTVSRRPRASNPSKGFFLNEGWLPAGLFMAL